MVEVQHDPSQQNKPQLVLDTELQIIEIQTNTAQPELAKQPAKQTYLDTMSLFEKRLMRCCEESLIEFGQLSEIEDFKVLTLKTLEWIGKTTFHTSSNGSSLQMNLAACTYAKFMIDRPEGFHHDFLLFAESAADHLVEMMIQKLREFYSRNPETYKSPSCIDTYWP